MLQECRQLLHQAGLCSSLRIFLMPAATPCEGPDNQKQCTHQEREGCSHCWKEEVGRHRALAGSRPS